MCVNLRVLRRTAEYLYLGVSECIVFGCAHICFESMDMLLKIITILWGGVLNCVIIFVPLQ